MKRYLMILAALSMILSGCGKEEEPKMEQAAEEPTMEQKAEEAAPMAEEGMAEEAAPMAEEAPAMEEPAAEEAPAMEEPAAEAEMPAAQTAAPEETAAADTGKGKQIYDSVCFACHAMGVAGAPKLDDKAGWAPRIDKGMDTLVSHAINGFQGESGVMPPKGGRMDLSDDDVAAAVAYMVEQAK
jgi:cytochrome c5